MFLILGDVWSHPSREGICCHKWSRDGTEFPKRREATLNITPPPHSPISNLHSHLTTYTLLSKSFYVARSDISARQLTALASESEGHRFKYHLGRLSVQWPCSNYLSSLNLLLCLENGGNQIQFTELLQIIKLNDMVKRAHCSKWYIYIW